MSTTVISQGFIAVLVNPLNDEQREEFNEKHWESDSILRVNCEGTLLSSDIHLSKRYSERGFYGDFFLVGSPDDSERDEFIEKAKEAGMEVEPATIKPYACIWYNGYACPVSLQTKEEFKRGR